MIDNRPIALPAASKTAIFFAITLLIIDLYLVGSHEGMDLSLALGAFLLSGIAADFFTALAHFGFDYVFPAHLPILGPVAKEFREHHDCPTLDPEDYVVNFSKGAYCSLPLTLAVLILANTFDQNWFSFTILATLLGMGFWGFFFHQIHSYAHMGSTLPPKEFNRRALELAKLPNAADQVRGFDELFQTVDIHPLIRLLQRCRLLLNPGVHNLHHIGFESHFSSVNGWSDPLANLILRPLSRRMKAKMQPRPV
jgi:hypothetical protein